MTLLLLLPLKSLLVFALSGLTLLCLRRASASARHLVCLLTLSALLALPLFSLALPAWHLARLQTRDAEAAPVYQEPTPVRPSPALPVKEGKEFEQEAHLASAASSSGSSLAGKAPAKQRGGFLMQGDGFLALYLFGVLLAALRPLLGLWGIAHLRRACIDVADTPTLSVAADCAAALGLKRLPLLCRADVPVPMTWGWLRPVVLLPLGSVDWPQDRLRSVLLHELAHVKRRDWPCHRLADIACALYWFHPFVWLIARRLRTESEVACDDLVLSSGIPAPDCARHLLDIAQALPPASRPPQSAAIAMAQTPHIKRRILMVLDKSQSRRTVTRRALLIALIPSAAALLTLAGLRPSVKAQGTLDKNDASSTAALPAAASSPSTLLFLWPGGSSVRMSSEPHNGMTITAYPGLMTTTDLTDTGTTLLAGVSNPHSDGNKWWSAAGALLRTPVYDTTAASHAYQGPDVQNVELAFRLPPLAQGVTVRYKLPQSTNDSSDGDWPGKLRDDAGLTESRMFAATGGARIVSASFPPTLKKTNVQVGIASGAWKRAATEIRTPSAVEPFEEEGTTLAGNQSFILGQPVQAAKEVMLTISDTSVDDIRVVAVDMQGNTLFPSSIGGQSVSNLDQITAHFSQPLSQIKEFRVETRPFQWIEFKDVALQPVK